MFFDNSSLHFFLCSILIHFVSHRFHLFLLERFAGGGGVDFYISVFIRRPEYFLFLRSQGDSERYSRGKGGVMGGGMILTFRGGFILCQLSFVLYFSRSIFHV